MSDIIVSEAKKVNILDKIIQNVVIMVNISKMNRAIDEHLTVIKNTERELEAYLAKYHPEKLKEYYNKKEEAKKSEKEGFEPGE